MKTNALPQANLGAPVFAQAPAQQIAQQTAQQAAQPSYLALADAGFTLANIKGWMEEYGSPLHVYSETAVLALAQGFLQFAKASGRNTHSAFAIKACPSLTILKLLRTCGFLAEVNSENEYRLALAAGFAPQQIHINGVAKSKALLDLALLQGCRALHIDAVEELDLLAQRAQALGRRIRLQLRLCPEVDSGRSAALMTGSSQSPFGIMLQDLAPALDILRQQKAHLELFGLHMHAGSGGALASAYPQMIELVLAAWHSCRQAGLSGLREINMGGGFVSDESNYQKIAGQGTLLNHLQRLPEDAELMFEPGRFLVEHAAALYCKIAATKHKAGQRWLFLDAGYNHLTDRAIIGARFPVLPLEGDRQNAQAVRLAGPLCDAADIYQAGPDDIQQTAASFAFPRTADIGDIVEIARAGAYVYSTGNHFAGLAQPAVLLIQSNGQPHLMRRGEQFADLCALENP